MLRDTLGLISTELTQRKYRIQVTSCCAIGCCLPNGSSDYTIACSLSRPIPINAALTIVHVQAASICHPRSYLALYQLYYRIALFSATRVFPASGHKSKECLREGQNSLVIPVLPAFCLSASRNETMPRWNLLKDAWKHGTVSRSHPPRSQDSEGEPQNCSQQASSFRLNDLHVEHEGMILASYIWASLSGD